MIRKDLRSKPVNRMVVMGESNAYGMCAGNPKNEWVQVLADCIREFQEEPLKVFNDLGQRLIGLTVFCKIASACSFLSDKSRRMEERLGLNI